MNRWPAILFLALLAPGASGQTDPQTEQRRTIHLLIRDLADRKAEVRDDAERKLVLQGEAAVPELVAALENRHLAVATMPADKNETARARAAKVLAALGGKRAEPHLIRALDDRAALVRRAAVAALGSIRCRAAVPKLIELAKGGDPALASDAAIALGSVGDAAAVPTLIELLAGGDAVRARYKKPEDAALVRASAAFALGMLKDTAAAPALLAALRDPEARVRRHADLALRAISGKNLGFRAEAPEADREKAARAWDALWKAKLEK